MLRMPIYLTIVSLLFVAAGCGKQESPVDERQSTEVVNPPSKPETAEDTSLTASQTLKQAMVETTAELMQAKQPEVNIDAIRDQVEQGIIQIRKDVPEFLMVSVKTESDLQSGAKRKRC